MCSDACSSVHDAKCIEFVVVNAGYVDLSLVLEVDACVVAEYSTVGSTINQGTALAAVYNMIGDRVADVRLGVVKEGEVFRRTDWNRRYSLEGPVVYPEWYSNSSRGGLQIRWS